MIYLLGTAFGDINVERRYHHRKHKEGYYATFYADDCDCIHECNENHWREETQCVARLKNLTELHSDDEVARERFHIFGEWRDIDSL